MASDVVTAPVALDRVLAGPSLLDAMAAGAELAGQVGRGHAPAGLAEPIRPPSARSRPLGTCANSSGRSPPSRTATVVCHGGNNTVMEALTAGVPVLAGPALLGSVPGCRGPAAWPSGRRLRPQPRRRERARPADRRPP